MMVNILLFASFILNGYFISRFDFLRLKKPIPAESINPVFYEQAPSLRSSANPDEDLFDRSARLKKQYELDRLQPDYSHYESDREKLKREWLLYCIAKVRKIKNIEARLDQHAVALIFINGEKSSTHEGDVTPIEKSLEQTYALISELDDISNYYAKFLSNETYRSILQGTD